MSLYQIFIYVWCSTSLSAYTQGHQYDCCKRVCCPITLTALILMPNRFSVTITSRLMLNIQNPALFETSGIQTTSTRMNPFVTTMVDRGSTSALDTYFSTDPSHLSPPTWYNSIWTRGNLHTDSEDIGESYPSSPIGVRIQ